MNAQAKSVSPHVIPRSYTLHNDSGFLTDRRQRKANSYDANDFSDRTKKFRLIDQALKYKFLFRPHEDKTIKQKEERDWEQKKKKGVIGDPNRTALRLINKIFDVNRVKAKQ